MSEPLNSPEELFPGFKVAPNDPSREIRPAFTVAPTPEDFEAQERSEFDDDYASYDGPCGECQDGMIVTCIDDICRGAGYCMHGDGERLCPRCGGL